MFRYKVMRNDDNTNLFKAIKNGNTAKVKELITRVSINDKNDEGKTPLHVAAQKGDLEIVNLLLNLEVDINAQDSEGNTPLHVAAQYGHHNTSEALIKKGATVDTTTLNGKTPLHKAFRYLRNPKIIELLIKSGANIEAKDSTETTPFNSLDTSTLDTDNKYQYQNIITFLAKYMNEADKNKYEKNLTLAMSTHEKSENEPLGKIIAAPELRNLILQGKSTPLPSEAMLDFIPKKHRNNVLYALLKEKGVNAKDSNGKTQLHIAANSGEIQTVKLLIEAGADVNATDRFGDTALHNATNKGHIKVVELLIDAGADVNIKNINDSKAVDLSKRNDISRLLKQPKASCFSWVSITTDNRPSGRSP